MIYLHWILLGLAILALLGVVFEEVTHINKAKVTLFFGTLSWLLLFIHETIHGNYEGVQHGLESNISEIASLWLFLVAAMTFVAYLNKKGMIENLIYLFLPQHISEKKLLFLTAIFCFLFSSLADNITATLVSIALVLSLNLPTAKTLRFSALVVFAVNSGGVALITGDVTTLMIFLDNRVGIVDLMMLSLPALISVLMVAGVLSFGLKGDVAIQRHPTTVRRVDMAISGLFLLTIISTIVLNAIFKVPPVLTFLFGMSIMFLIARFFNDDNDLDPILEYVRIIEFETLLFFLGILLIVGVLKEVGVLNSLVEIYSLSSPMIANYLMGLLSALIDNVPLTAAVLKSGIDMTKADWLALTYSVGVGGSLLVIGSAAGIVAMSKVKDLTFAGYARYSAVLLFAFTLGYINVYFLGRLLA
ncbi:sodium:proton antiporter [Hahella sp. CCB-MM4]|uniref:sodium:proton antiporter NhaD n=1 Tax=Hahella sp. (strain CCB-MM4) TaxID=1926491 RepID=UPI000B9AE40E|nr:sodium:proton antiporter NhaD [Hahella sp. CCB-MM4]OZG70251.1 sodium:proton antiporter [Hahella sp. CCB-MM4]